MPELEAGFDEGDCNFDIAGLVPPACDDALAWVDVTPGRLEAIAAAAMTLAVVAETATARTRARPRLLAAIGPRGSCVLCSMTVRIAGLVAGSRRAALEPAQNSSGTVRP